MKAPGEAPATREESPRVARASLVRPVDLAVLLVTVGGLALAITSAHTIALTDMTDLGLASVLPVQYWTSLAVICCAFALGLTRRPTNDLTLAIPTSALVVAAFGVDAFASQVPRDHVAFRHVGVVDHLATTGWPDGSIDAYFSWPGFFSVGAFLSDAAGGADLSGVARWAPILAHLALLAPLLLLTRALLPDARGAWVAVWVATMWDWVDQDYFSPQTYDLGLHLAILGLTCGWLIVRRAGAAAYSPDTVRQRVGVYLVALGLGLALVPSHQLTPIATVLTLGALVIARRLPQVGLPVVLALGVAIWLVTGAGQYVAGHDLLTMPDLRSLLSGDVGSRVRGSELHHLVVMERMAMSAALWVLATLGGVRAWRAHRPVLVPALLAVTPFVLLPLQAYGGEMLLRVQLFALPGMAVLVACLLAPPEAGRWTTAVCVLLISAVALPGLIVARYGTDRLEIYTPGEVAAVDALYEAVPKGGLLVTAVPYTPWRDHDYATYEYVTLVDLAKDDPDPRSTWDGLMSSLKDAGTGGVLITRTAREAAEMLGPEEVQRLSEFEVALSTDPRFESIHRSDDGTVYIYRADADRTG